MRLGTVFKTLGGMAVAYTGAISEDGKTAVLYTKPTLPTQRERFKAQVGKVVRFNIFNNKYACLR